MKSSFGTTADGLPYLLFVPSLGPREDRGLPLIVFLHGRGERGDSADTLDRVTVHGLPRLAEAGRLPDVGDRPFPFLVVCPQTPHTSWQVDSPRVLALMHDLVQDGGADPERCYVTGISLGAIGSWQLAAAPARAFAALVPVSWDVPPEARAVDAAAWVFVGGRDKFVDAEDVERHLYAARSCDERTRFTIEPEAGHDGRFWNDVYARTELYEWLLGHRRQPRAS